MSKTLPIFADGGYEGKDFMASVEEDYHLDWEVIKREQCQGFKVLPWRWIVERTLASVDTLQTVNY